MHIACEKPTTQRTLHGELVATLANYETVRHSYQVRMRPLFSDQRQAADKLKALRTYWEECILEGQAFLAV